MNRGLEKRGKKSFGCQKAEVGPLLNQSQLNWAERVFGSHTLEIYFFPTVDTGSHVTIALTNWLLLVTRLLAPPCLNDNAKKKKRVMNRQRLFGSTLIPESTPPLSNNRRIKIQIIKYERDRISVKIVCFFSGDSRGVCGFAILMFFFLSHFSTYKKEPK